MEQITLTAPDSWASYLIYGDASGLDDIEIEACNAWIKSEFSNIRFSCVDATDAGFINWHDASKYALASTCCEYTFLIG